MNKYFIFLMPLILLSCSAAKKQSVSQIKTEVPEMEPAIKIVREIIAAKTQIKIQRIAVAEFTDGKGRFIPEGKLLAERISTELSISGEYDIIERSRITEILKEQEVSQTGLIDEAYISNLGKMLGAEAILTGTIITINNISEINARLIETETGKVLTGATAKSKALTGQLSVDIGLIYEDKEGTLKNITEGEVLNSGAGYAVYIKPDQECYLYVFQVDDPGHSFKLFPNDKYSPEKNPVPEGRVCWIPNSEQLLVLDETTGKERFYIFASPYSINELEKVLELEKENLDRVMKTMGIAGVKDKAKPDSVILPRQTIKAAEIKKKLQSEGAFVYETWFWHK